MKNLTANKQFKFMNTTGECLFTPHGEPSIDNDFNQPIECCFTASDPTGRLLGDMIDKAGRPDNVPKHFIGSLLRKLFGITDFDTYGITVIECHGSVGGDQEIHIHTHGFTRPFDVQSWNDEIRLTAVLRDCKIKRS